MTTEDMLRAKKWSDIKNIMENELLGKESKTEYGFTE